MNTPPPQPDRDGRDESREERADRNLVELLQELRVLQTGVQIIFAFLLGVAFTARFPQLNDTQRYVYVASLLLSVMSAAVFATPVALHRGLFRCGQKERIVTLSTRLAKIGMVLLAIAVECVVFVLIDVVLGRISALLITGAGGAMFCLLWFVLPWSLRQR